MTQAPSVETLDGLARTLLLIRDHIRPGVPDVSIAQVLLGTRVAVIGDRPNMRVEAAQHALVTTALSDGHIQIGRAHV